jgi:hypothetical protein
MNKEVADIEVYKNFFCYVGFNIDTKEWYIYHLHDSMKNDIITFIDRMNSGIAFIGFNNQGYDYPVIHKLSAYKTVLGKWTSAEVLQKLKIINDEIISGTRSYITPRIPILDLMKMHHFDNHAKTCSLKHLQVAMRLESVEDLPFNPNSIIDEKDIDIVLDYCKHDVSSTYDFFMKSQMEFGLRAGLSKTYNLDLFDSSDADIGSELVLKFIHEKTCIPKAEIKQMRTFRKEGIILKDIILPYIEFKTSEFQKILKDFQDKVVINTKGDLSYTTTFKDIPYDYGTGGIHACTKGGSYFEDENCMILDIDVTSFYPNLAIRNRQAPEHLGSIFCEVYENIFEERKLHPKGSPENYGLKIALNAVYGKSNSEYSFLYDPKFTMFITVNGQLLITLLTENILLNTDAVLLQANTDGITVKISRNQYDTVKQIMKDWEILTGLELEEAQYKSMFIRDVNSYLAVTTSGKYKGKGDLEIDKAWHKDHSMRIVRIAVARDLMFNIPYVQTIRDHLSTGFYEDLKVDNYGIYDFCKAVRSKGGARFELFNRTKIMEPIPLPKTVRYYMSKSGISIRKILPPDPNKKGDIEREKEKHPNQLSMFDFVEDVRIDLERPSEVEAGNDVIIFNKYVDGPYNLDMSYYENECEKIISKIRC